MAGGSSEGYSVLGPVTVESGSGEFDVTAPQAESTNMVKRSKYFILSPLNRDVCTGRKFPYKKQKSALGVFHKADFEAFKRFWLKAQRTLCHPV